MKQFRTLLKVEIKDYLAKTMSKLGTGSKRKLGPILLVVLYLVFLNSTAMIAAQYSEAFTQAGFPEITITLMYIGANLLILFLSITSLISTFFYSKDTKFLATLPVSESSIIFAKLGVQYIFSFALASLFLLPAMFFYSKATGYALTSAIMQLVLLILTPLLPLLLATLVILMFMRVIGTSSSRRNTLTIVMSLVLVVFMFGMQYIMMKQTMNQDFGQTLLKEDGLLHFVSRRFPPSMWATKMVTGSLLHALLFLGFNALLLGAISFTARPLFQRALQAFGEGQAHSKGKQKASYRRSSVLTNLIKRNLQIVFKTPAFVLNTVMILLVPIIIIGLQAATGVLDLKAVLSHPMLKEYAGLIYAGLLIAPAFMGAFSATVITREGKHFWQTKVLPVSVEQDLNARIASSVVISAMGLVPYAILGAFYLPLTPVDMVMGILVAIVGTIAFSVLDLIIDINRPVLNWTNPNQAMKNNLNTMIALGLRLVLILAGVFTKNILLSVSSTGYLVLLFGLMVALGVASHAYIRTHGVRKFASIEL